MQYLKNPGYFNILFKILSMNRILSICALTIVIASTSCKKETITVKSNFDYLIAGPWVYKKYYTGYVDANNLGTLQYERGKPGNTMDLDNDISTYLFDNTLDEVADGKHYPGDWHFLNKDLTQLVVSNEVGDFVTTVVLMDDYHYNFYYTDAGGIKRYGELVHP